MCVCVRFTMMIWKKAIAKWYNLKAKMSMSSHRHAPTSHRFSGHQFYFPHSRKCNNNFCEFFWISGLLCMCVYGLTKEFPLMRHQATHYQSCVLHIIIMPAYIWHYFIIFISLFCFPIYNKYNSIEFTI